MARISFEESEKHFSQSSSEWFSLKNDGDTARVQFMLNSIEDIPIFSVHKVQVGDKERYVDCLRSVSDPIDKCPLCASGIAAKPVKYIVMYDHADQVVKIWERGKQFISKLQGLINRYNPLSNYVFEIERHGKAGDRETKYEIYAMDGVEAYDLTDVEMPDFEGGLILQKTAEEMDIYLTSGSFPDNGDNQSSNTAGRRTPASNPEVVRRNSPQPSTSRAGRRSTSNSEVF